MMLHFGQHIEKLTGKSFDHSQHCVCCLAHIVNLATQALISTHSKSKPYNPQKPDEDLIAHREDQFDELLGEDEAEAEVVTQRDKVGLVCLIVVKECSSAKQKQMFLDLQKNAGQRPRQLLGDIPICWSSTYVMLDRAETLKQRLKSQDLNPTKKEWARVSLFLKLLMRVENAQQAFSTEQGPTLHLAITALESLHAVWSKCREQECYKDFHVALDAAFQKISNYYDKTAESEVYTFAMQDDGILPNDDATSPVNSEKPWICDFHGYLNSMDSIGEMTIVTWWSINASQYPVWASLAHDYLSIMAYSVSSERAFSSAGITISKQRNRLKADVVKALQFLKCLFHKDLLFWDDPSVSTELDSDNQGEVTAADHDEDGWDALVGEDGWDALVGEDGEEDDLLLSLGDDDEDVYIADI
ncbi:hypothetical protein C0991_003134 [Blastosporella zonata]|nr:hypothetical protein C0991_003134 [Blastosporella zonata]